MLQQQKNNARARKYD